MKIHLISAADVSSNPMWLEGKYRLALMTLVISTLLIANSEQMPVSAANAKGTIIKATNTVRELTPFTQPEEAVAGGNDTDEVQTKHVTNQFANLRQGRLFGLFGTNFSLSYNLTVGGSNTAGNVTVVAAPATYYYYAPAPLPPPVYQYGYYYPYPYDYNPYAYYPYVG